MGDKPPQYVPVVVPTASSPVCVRSNEPIASYPLLTVLALAVTLAVVGLVQYLRTRRYPLRTFGVVLHRNIADGVRGGWSLRYDGSAGGGPAIVVVPDRVGAALQWDRDAAVLLRVNPRDSTDAVLAAELWDEWWCVGVAGLGVLGAVAAVIRLRGH